MSEPAPRDDARPAGPASVHPEDDVLSARPARSVPERKATPAALTLLAAAHLAAAAVCAQPAGGPRLLLEQPQAGELLEVGFELSRPADVRIESVVLVTRDGFELLTKFSHELLWA